MGIRFSTPYRFRGALARRTGDLGMTGPLVYTYVDWDVADYDTDSIWSAVNPTRLTVPAGITMIRLYAHVVFTGQGGGTWLLGEIHRNFPATIISRWTGNRSVGVGIGMGQGWFTPPFTVVGGDYFQLYVGHTFFGLSWLACGGYSALGMEILQ